MIIRIDGKDYPAKAAEELSILDLLRLEAETKALGRPITLTEIRAMDRAVGKITHKDPATQREMRGSHPDALWLLGIQIWASMRGAGVETTFTAAISTPLSKVRWIAEDDDAPEVKAAMGPTRARPASGRAAKSPAGSRTRKTSARR